MAEVVDLSQHLPVADKELMDTLRSLLSEAQNGRLRSYAAVYIAIEAVASGATGTE